MPPRNQVREFKEAFGFFNSINSRDTELSVDEIHEVMARFEPHREIEPKVRLLALELSAPPGPGRVRAMRHVILAIWLASKRSAVAALLDTVESSTDTH